MAIGLPAVEGVPGNATDVASGLREMMTAYLNGPSLKVVALDSRLPSQQTEEARQKGCSQLLVLSVRRKSGGGGWTKALGEAAGATAWAVPYGAGASAAARAATVGGLRAAASLASSTKSKDELRLEYRVQSTSGQVMFGPKTEKQKATVDGEDLLTPVASRAADAIVTRGKA
jgi:hypothetical protein